MDISATAGPRILIVEDDDLVRTHAAMTFEELGYAVLSSDSAEAALALLESQGRTVTALFTDISLAGEASGLKLAREVHARWPDMRILVASGRALPQEEDLPPQARFIAKPWLVEDVVAALG